MQPNITKNGGLKNINQKTQKDTSKNLEENRSQREHFKYLKKYAGYKQLK